MPEKITAYDQHRIN